MWPGMRPATGWMANLHVHAALGQRVVEFADLVLGLGDGHAVAGNDDDLAGRREDGRRLLGAWRCDTAALPARRRPQACTWPKAPNSTLVNERFIAFDMMTRG